MEGQISGTATHYRAGVTLDLQGAGGVVVGGWPVGRGGAGFGTTFFGGKPTSRDAIVDELTQMTLHGCRHRDG